MNPGITKPARTCFERTIDKDMYPPFEKPEPIYIRTSPDE
jgi:hypothetical protein